MVGARPSYLGKLELMRDYPLILRYAYSCVYTVGDGKWLRFQLILYLSMLHFGYMETRCVIEGGKCKITSIVPPVDDCCGGLVCDYSRGICTTCLGYRNDPPRDCSLEYSNCCPGYYCQQNGNCRPCPTGDRCHDEGDCQNPDAGGGSRSMGANCPMECDREMGCLFIDQCVVSPMECSPSQPCCPGLVCIDTDGEGHKCHDCITKNENCKNSDECCENYLCIPLRKVCDYCGIGAICAKNEDCLGPYCPGVQCFDGMCQGKCATRGGQCTDDDDCCINLTCFEGTCLSCTLEDHQCGNSHPDCCPPLTCFEGTCQDCFNIFELCPGGNARCCGNFTCFAWPDTLPSCMPCMSTDMECGDNFPDCCPGLTCFKATDSTPSCMHCTPITMYCADTIPDCCPGSTCFEYACQACIAENQPCGGAQTLECCGTMVCSDGKCQNCTAEGETCGD